MILLRPEVAAAVDAETQRLLDVGVRDPRIARRCAYGLVLVHPAHARRKRAPLSGGRKRLHGLGGRRRAPREHGSERGYQQHHTDGTPACDPCLAAHAEHKRSRSSR